MHPHPSSLLQPTPVVENLHAHSPLFLWDASGLYDPNLHYFLVPLSLVPERTDQQILARPPALHGLKP